MEDNDVVAERQSDGRYRIRRWRKADETLYPIPGHEDLYDESEMARRLVLAITLGRNPTAH